MFHVQIYRVPYSVCADEERKTIVIAVRGTLSLKVLNDYGVPEKEPNIEHPCPHLQDALTDVSFPLVKIDVQRDDCTGNEVPIPDSHVHKVRWILQAYWWGRSNYTRPFC